MPSRWEIPLQQLDAPPKCNGLSRSRSGPGFLLVFLSRKRKEIQEGRISHEGIF